MTTTKIKVDVEIDSHIHAQATELLNHMGIDQAAAIDMFYRQIITLRQLTEGDKIRLMEFLK